MKYSCDFCGAEAHAWQGDIAWCGSDACDVRHQWATHEPRLLPWIDPTPTQRLVGWLLYWPYLWAVLATPARWLTDGGIRERWAIAVYGGAYFWGERSEGRC